MSLARVHDPLSLALVHRLGDAGGPRADHVAAELDAIIDYVNTLPRNIHRDTSTVGNVGAGLDVLHTFSLDTPNRLLADGDYLSVWYGGSFAGNDTDKRVNAFFGGTAYESVPTVDIDGGNWIIQARIVRLSSTSVRVSHVMQYFAVGVDSANTVNAFSTGYFSVTRVTDITGLANLNSNATTMEVKGEGAANNDVTQSLSIIELTQQ